MKRLLVLLAALVVSALGAGYYMLAVNPEVRFARLVFAEQGRQLEETSDGPRVILVGGSSCSFSLDPALLQDEFGLSVCNLGLPAGTGRGVHFEQALQHARRGDAVILAFEMSGWTGEEGDLITPLGSQLWYAGLRKAAGDHSQLQSLGINEAYDLSALRPGGKHCLTMAMKVALRKPLFRYEEEAIRTGGYLCNTTHDWPLQPRRGVEAYRLDPAMAGLLDRFVDVMRDRGVRVAATLPWYYTGETVVVDQREANRALVAELAPHVAVLADEHMGVEADRALFSDTNWHLSDTGARLRTREFGRGLRAWLN